MNENVVSYTELDRDLMATILASRLTAVMLNGPPIEATVSAFQLVQVLLNGSTLEAFHDLVGHFSDEMFQLLTSEFFTREQYTADGRLIPFNELPVHVQDQMRAKFAESAKKIVGTAP
jgi:hypothetical protein